MEQDQVHQIMSMLRVEEIAEFIFWLSSDKASFINGSYHPIDDGYLAN
ncbi:MAG: hypothetical protein WD607_09785 [Candidatus Paceibacterota bacterium]